MAKPSHERIKLKVAEAVQDDVNKGIVRIDSSFMRQLGLRPGDIVEIEGTRKTVGIVDRAYPGDIGLSIIRMDSLLRKNAKTSIGEQVSISKADVTEAKKVTIAPAREGVVVKANPTIFKQGLLGRALVRGDIVSLGGTRRRRNTMSGNPFFDDVFSMLDEHFIVGFGFGDLKFVVVETNPKNAVIITEQTEVVLNPEAIDVKEESRLEVAYEDVGGLEDEIKKIREMVELPLRHPEVFERLGIEPPKGVLLHGPPGTGKTLLAKAVASETHCHFISINGPEIMSKYYGQSEENLRKKFEEAEKNAPSILFIDEIDAIASKREETKGEVERRVVAQLLTLMDGLKSRGRVVVIAATNVPNILDSALRRPGRFDREVDIGVPNKEGRLKILKIHTRNMPLSTDHIYPDVFEEVMLRSLQKRLEHSKTRDVVSDDSSGVQTVSQQALHSELSALSTQVQHSPQQLKRALAGAKQVLDTKHIWNIQDSQSDFAHVLPTEDQKLLDALINYHVLTRDVVRQCQSVGAERDLHDIANITHGFVGADLANLAKEAAMVALRRILPEIHYDREEPISQEMLEKLMTTKKDFLEALKVVKPSALREVLVEVPNVTWSRIGGLEQVKQEVSEAVEWPLKYPESFLRMGITPPKGILLYGPPGTGKTLLAKAIATESEANFISIKGPQLLSMWIGESEKGVRKVFEKARQTSPCILFFDEIDALAPRRGISPDSHVTERVVNQLLTEIDGIQNLHNVVIIGATNRPDILDTALLRPGRFDRIILTPVPDSAAREAIFSVHLSEMPLSDDVSVSYLAERSQGYVGADIEGVCREAAILALREDIQANLIAQRHFDAALEKVPPSVTPDIEKTYEEMQKHFSSARARELEKEKPSYLG